MDYGTVHKRNTEIRDAGIGGGLSNPDDLEPILYDTVEVATAVSAFVGTLRDDYQCLSPDQITEAMKIYTDHLMRAKVEKWTRLYHWRDK